MATTNYAPHNRSRVQRAASGVIKRIFVQFFTIFTIFSFFSIFTIYYIIYNFFNFVQFCTIFYYFLQFFLQFFTLITLFKFLTISQFSIFYSFYNFLQFFTNFLQFFTNFLQFFTIFFRPVSTTVWQTVSSTGRRWVTCRMWGSWRRRRRSTAATTRPSSWRPADGSTWSQPPLRKNFQILKKFFFKQSWRSFQEEVSQYCRWGSNTFFGGKGSFRVHLLLLKIITCRWRHVEFIFYLLNLSSFTEIQSSICVEWCLIL